MGRQGVGVGPLKLWETDDPGVVADRPEHAIEVDAPVLIDWPRIRN